jgi:hypothetical protein
MLQMDNPTQFVEALHFIKVTHHRAGDPEDEDNLTLGVETFIEHNLYLPAAHNVRLTAGNNRGICLRVPSSTKVYLYPVQQIEIVCMRTGNVYPNIVIEGFISSKFRASEMLPWETTGIPADDDDAVLLRLPNARKRRGRKKAPTYTNPD